MAGTLTLIGAGEFAPGMAPVYRRLLAGLKQPRAVFLDTPAGFQTNADDLASTAQSFFRDELAIELRVASLRRADIPADHIASAREQLAEADLVLAGPGSPTYASRHWRAVGLDSLLRQRFEQGAHLVFASAAAITLGRWALPVYEIYKVGDDPYWAEGLDLLGPDGFALAILTHWNNPDPRCFIGLERFEALASQLDPQAVILGVDEDTAVTLDLKARTALVAGAGGATVQYRTASQYYPAGTLFGLDQLTPAAVQKQAQAGRAAAAPRPPREGPYIPGPIRKWAERRQVLREEKKYAQADRLRDRIAATGYTIKDSPEGPVFDTIEYATAGAVPSPAKEAGRLEWSVLLLAGDSPADTVRAAESALRHAGEHVLEVVVVDDGTEAGLPEALVDAAVADERVRLIRLAQPQGEGAGRNASLRAARGENVLILGSHMEIEGDVFSALGEALADESVGAAGSNPLITTDLFSFHPAPEAAEPGGPVEADALEFYLFAFRRSRIEQVGDLDEKFVFYRNLDLDWSLAFKDKGLRLVGTPGLPLAVHEHPYLRMDPAERDRLSKKNYRRFLDKWRDRTDLLVQSASGLEDPPSG